MRVFSFFTIILYTKRSSGEHASDAKVPALYESETQPLSPCLAGNFFGKTTILSCNCFTGNIMIKQKI